MKDWVAIALGALVICAVVIGAYNWGHSVAIRQSVQDTVWVTHYDTVKAFTSYTEPYNDHYPITPNPKPQVDSLTSRDTLQSIIDVLWARLSDLEAVDSAVIDSERYTAQLGHYPNRPQNQRFSLSLYLKEWVQKDSTGFVHQFVESPERWNWMAFGIGATGAAILIALCLLLAR